MAEYIRSFSENGNVQPATKKKTVANEAYKVGEFLKMAGGKVTKASGTDKPEYLCGQDAEFAISKEILVFPILSTTEFKAIFTADATAINEGDKVTISADGMGATATTAGGTLTIARKMGSKVGNSVYLKV